VGRFFGSLFLMLVVLAVALAFFARDFVGMAAEHALKRAGYEDVVVEVSALSTTAMIMGPISAYHPQSAQALALEHIEISYHWRDLFENRRIRNLIIGPGNLIGSLSEDGTLVLAGVKMPNGPNNASSMSAGLPFNDLKIHDLEFALLTPRGPIDAFVEGVFSVAEGGWLKVNGVANKAGMGGTSSLIEVSDGAAMIDASFAADGTLNFDATLFGNASLEKFRVRKADISLDGEGTNWRALLGGDFDQLMFKAKMNVENIVVEPVAQDENVTDQESDLFAQFDEVFGSVKGKGIVGIERSSSETVISFPDGPLVFISDKDDILAVSATNEKAVFSKNKAGQSLAVRLEQSGRVDGYLTLGATAIDGVTWDYQLETAFDRQLIGRTILRDAQFKLTGRAGQNFIDGMLDGDITISAASIGRLRVKDAPAKTRLGFHLDLDKQTLLVAPDGTGCASVKHVALRVIEQGMNSNLKNAKICATGAPLLSVDWTEVPLIVGLGAFTASNGRYQLGATMLDGVPPSITFALNYQPDIETTAFSGDLVGGDFTVNEVLEIRQPEGKFSVDLIGDRLSGNAEMTRAIAMQPGDEVVMTPVLVRGKGALADNKVNFDVMVATQEGRDVAQGSGIHNVETAEGEATFSSLPLEFAVGGLQPHDIAAVLRGVVSDATGAASGKVAVAWDQDGLLSSGDFQLNDLTFLGPGAVITRTANIRGDLQFQSLLPIATKGEQIVEIGVVDLGALSLENGVVRFELPGDETLKILKASFPWFGGSIGAYETEMPLTGEKIQTLFRTENVNLKDLLAELDIEGLSGEGLIEGVLPILIESGRARIDQGILSAVGPGVIRYRGKATDALADSNQQADVAFNILRELRFTKLSATIDGPLDGNLNFNIFMEGESDVPIDDPRVKETVSSPVIYRVSLDAPLLALFEQARLSTDIQLQYERQLNSDASQDTERGGDIE